MLSLATTALGIGWTGFGAFTLRNSFNSVVNKVLFNRYTNLNLTKHRKKNFYNYEKFKTIYIHSLDKNYSQTVVYFHGSGGTIHDREFVCQMLDYFEVNYIIVEYPIGMNDVLLPENLKQMSEAVDYILEYHKLEHDVIWGTSLGGNVATWLFNNNKKYKKLVHCVSFFDLSDSDSKTISSVSKLYRITLPKNITNEKLIDDDRKKLIISTKRDEYFKSQIQTHQVTESENVKILYVSGSHSTIQLQNASKDISSWGGFRNPTEGEWAYLDSLRHVVLINMTDLYD